MNNYSDYAKLLSLLGLTSIGGKVLNDKYSISSDVNLIRKLFPLAFTVLKKVRTGENWSVVHIWYDILSKFPFKTAMIFEGYRLSFTDIENLSNLFAHYFYEKMNVRNGDVVALCMENCPEFVCAWLGITKIGGILAFINFSLTDDSLKHAISISKAKYVLTDVYCYNNVKQVVDNGVILFNRNNQQSIDNPQSTNVISTEYLYRNFKTDWKDFTTYHCVKPMDTFGYIYTSGTTGLPKAAKVTHARMYLFGSLMKGAGGVSDQDVIYCCLPIFHSAGGGIGVMMMMLTGATLFIVRKFSAQHFWKDVVNYNCTVIQYIGEICRYLVTSHGIAPPPKHKLRLAIGNGLRPEVWDQFQDGFNIPLIVEFYGATEGNGGLVNICHQSDISSRGAVGRNGSILKTILGYRLVKIDVDTEEPIRNKEGHCEEALPGEVGELIMPIKPNLPHTTFSGYTDEASTSKKLLKNCFIQGDLYFRSGDLLSRDSSGRYFFNDRIGDTFRWKGENVSTMQVGQVLSEQAKSIPPFTVSEIIVYGVKVADEPDGRACMAAIRFDDESENPTKESLTKWLNSLLQIYRRKLPSYSQPLFIRFLLDKSMNTSTATFKQNKVVLKKEGYRLNSSDDIVFECRSTGGDSFVCIDQGINSRI